MIDADLEASLESRRPQVHPVMTDHAEKTLLAFERALGVTVPRSHGDVPDESHALYILFRATVDSLLALRTPLSGFLDASLIFSKLEAAGDAGASVLLALRRTDEGKGLMQEAQLDILERLMEIFGGGASPRVTMSEVRATGIYPGHTPKDFDIFDHM